MACHTPHRRKRTSRFGWEWRDNVFSVDDRRVDENFEMGWRGDVFSVDNKGVDENFEMGVDRHKGVWRILR